MEWVKVLHIIAIICWMAGLLYLPRFFVYHVDASKEVQAQFLIMERKLLYYIMHPAMLLSIASGLILALYYNYYQDAWFLLKFSAVLFLVHSQILMGRYYKSFKQGTNIKSAKYFRYFNEAPTILMIFIVILVVIKPFYG